MRLKLALLTTALAFGLGTTVALAEDAPGAKSDITVVDNSGAANAPGSQAEDNATTIRARFRLPTNAAGDQPSGTPGTSGHRPTAGRERCGDSSTKGGCGGRTPTE